ncbi:hypothetical protein V1512DRAFT_138829 [Lipomyces arxii]|uniref:uncharacterized protein n=1 Tax=Lipomyces arxii TaxID=56418 RepID=UPI0034CF1E99
MDILTKPQWKTMLAFSDAIFAPVDVEVLRKVVPEYAQSKEYDKILVQFANDVPSKHKDFKRIIGTVVLSSLLPDHLADFKRILGLLDTKAGALVLTGQYKRVQDMTQSEVGEVLLGWANARIPMFRKLYRAMFVMTVVAFCQGSNIVYPAMRYRDRELNHNDPERYGKKTFYRFQMETVSDYEDHRFDAVIIGSGAGGGVAAARLAENGFSVLVLEKGKYYHQEELHFSEGEGLQNLYENCGVVNSDDQSVLILAGSTLGGGTTVNWCASLRTQGFVRKEWAQTHGVEFYDTKTYDDALDAVCERMGVSDKYLVHSKSNALLMEGSQKIGASVRQIPQNTGGAQHRCGFCAFGCRFGEKQGGTNCWLADAGRAGAKFAQQCQVRHIVHENGVASGVEVEQNGGLVTVYAKVVVCSAGSLHTPVVLRNSGFKNKNIGRHLQLHPTNYLHAIWKDSDFKSYDDTIMTVVNCHCENLDGKGRGVKIESMMQHPTPLYTAFPWHGPESVKSGMAEYGNTATYLLLARDVTEGTVVPDAASNKPRIYYELSDTDRRHLAIAAIHAAELVIAAGAEQVYAADRRISRLIVTDEIRRLRGQSNEFKGWAATVHKYMSGKYTTQVASAHQMASCRIGPSPTVSAAKVSGELWECKNVFVADASAMPSASGANPMVSVMATAYVISDSILERLKTETDLD